MFDIGQPDTIDTGWDPPIPQAIDEAGDVEEAGRHRRDAGLRAAAGSRSPIGWAQLVDPNDAWREIGLARRVDRRQRGIDHRADRDIQELPQGLSLAALRARILGVALEAQLGARLTPWHGALSRLDEIRILEISERLPLILSAAGTVPLAARGRYCFASAAARTVDQAAEYWPWLARVSLSGEPGAEAIPDCEMVLMHDDAPDVAGRARALAYARARLAPGGYLVILGQTPARWLDFVLGAQASWTARTRGVAPTQQGLAAWQAQLSAAGFTDMQSSALQGDGPSGAWLLFARGPVATPRAVPSHAAQRFFLLCDDASHALATALEVELTGSGAEVLCVANAEPETLAAQLAGVGEGDAVVLLAGLVAPQPLIAEATAMAQATRRCAFATAVMTVVDAHAAAIPCWLVTRNALGQQAASVADAVLWGFGRTLMNEADSAQIRLIDVGLLPAPAAAALAHALRASA